MAVKVARSLAGPLPLALLEHRQRTVVPNVSLLSVVSIWKIFDARTRGAPCPCASCEWCSSDLWRSMNDVGCAAWC